MSRHAWLALGIVLLGWALVLGLWALLGFDTLRSDAASYWQDALAWAMPYDAFHVPGYAWLIAAARAAFPVLPPLAMMQAVTLLALLAGAWLVYRILKDAGVEDEPAAWGALAYGLWPFVGVTYVALPVADAPALALSLAGTWALCRRRPYAAALLLGLALVTHKATWPLVALLWTALLLSRDRPRPGRTIGATALLLLPLAVLWAAGSMHHGTPAWLVSSNWAAEIQSTGALPVLDWIGDTLDRGGFGLVKGAVVVGVAALAAVLTWTSARAERPYAGYGAAIALAILLLCLALNRHEIWAAVRFSRMLVLPLGWSLLVSGAPQRVRDYRDGHRWVSGAARPLLAAALLASQLAYAWYMARVFAW